MDIKKIFNEAVKRKASDIHLVTGLQPILRIDGILYQMDKTEEITTKSMEEMVFSVLDAEQKEKFIKNKDLDLGYSLDGVRFRVNVHYEKGNIGLVARIINDDMPSLESIGMPKVVYDLLNLEQGLILVTGPTGCGKSTTLAAMINHINNNRSCNIITLEDPIEYIFKSAKSAIIQRELGADMVTFASGLKHCLRQDPDIIMVGEMRDLETISTALTLAETGHLVLATLHTYSAAQTIDRIIDIFPPHQQGQIKVQISMTLSAVISQRLLPKVGGGRIAAREVMFNTPAVANLIREDKVSQIKTVIETSAKKGMFSLDQNLKELYKEKLITKESAQVHMKNASVLDK